MKTLNEKLLRDVLALPSNLRTVLIDKLIASLNVPLQREVDELWAVEVEKRVEEIRSGIEKSIPSDDVFHEIRKRLKK
ncbi:MAG: addiction module protein [Promethearchaeota archaeon CR_4]|nr:MAG: addiction module protein [Candidatus Lokiarchaeota archaeon CR_4]